MDHEKSSSSKLNSDIASGSADTRIPTTFGERSSGPPPRQRWADITDEDDEEEFMEQLPTLNPLKSDLTLEEIIELQKSNYGKLAKRTFVPARTQPNPHVSSPRQRNNEQTRGWPFGRPGLRHPNDDPRSSRKPQPLPVRRSYIDAPPSGRSSRQD